MANPVLVEVTRGPLIESRHTGALAVVDAAGKVVVAVGDVEAPIFPRSAVKAIQALPLVESGAADAFGFGRAELALAASSHSGEPRHVATAAAMLAAAGRTAADLECGTHMPMAQAAEWALVRAGENPGPQHNNCSGKHAGFICTACHLGIDPHGYVGADHALQRAVTAALADLTDTRLEAANRGIDGCSIPAFAIPLERLALGFARMATGEGLAPARAGAARRIVEACMAEPFMVAGTGRFCTVVMPLFPGRLFAKVGAEGVYCGAFPDLGLGVALKIDDGAGRAAEVAMAAVVDAFLVGTNDPPPGFAALAAPTLRNRRDIVVGAVRLSAGLAAALRAAAAGVA